MICSELPVICWMKTHEMGSRGMQTGNWNTMLLTAFQTNNVGALNKVIARLRRKIEEHDARQGGPAAEILSPHVPDPAPPANAASAQRSKPSNLEMNAGIRSWIAHSMYLSA